MKKYFGYVAAMLTLGFGLAVSSCTQDLCKDKDCVNGTCDDLDGSCKCNAGYELGTTSVCDKEVRAKFLGTTWSGNENCGTPDTNPHTIVINAATEVTKVTISNFSQTNCSGSPLVATATVDGTNLKDFTASCTGYTINSATGSLGSDGKLTLTYNVTVGGTVYNCSTVYSK